MYIMRTKDYVGVKENKAQVVPRNTKKVEQTIST